MTRIWVRTSFVLCAAVALLTGVAGQASATDVPNTHSCQNFGGTNSSGYRAGHCANVDQSGTGNPALPYLESGHGEAFCQVASTGMVVQCHGISARITITDLTDGDTATATRTCGSYGGNPCPIGARFNAYSPGIFASCNHAYQATIRTTVSVSVDHNVVSSGNWLSYVHPTDC